MPASHVLKHGRLTVDEVLSYAIPGKALVRYRISHALRLVDIDHLQIVPRAELLAGQVLIAS